MTDYFLRVAAHPQTDTQKHVELLKNGVTVMADFFDVPLDLRAIGEEMLTRYNTPNGIYSLEGVPVISIPVEEKEEEEHEYPEEDIFPRDS